MYRYSGQRPDTLISYTRDFVHKAMTDDAKKSLRVLVTGGSGKVGQWVVRTLLDRGHAVCNIDRRPGDDARAQFFEADTRERRNIEPIMRDCDALCHLADIPNSDSPFPKDEIYWSNVRSASVVFQTAADLGLRHAVYSSSCQVYGCWGQQRVAPSRLPIDETCPVNPRNVYAVSKVANELFLQLVSREQNLGISIVRLPWVVISPEDENRLSNKFWKGDGPVDDGFATFIHGRDAALGIAAALETERGGCEVYNFAAADVGSIQPLRDRLERHHPDFPKLPAGWPDHKSPLVIEKAEKYLNWRPQWTFRGHLLASGSRS
jgi:nucleoside-diphosphate-sugar epimerase